MLSRQACSCYSNPFPSIPENSMNALKRSLFNVQNTACYVDWGWVSICMRLHNAHTCTAFRFHVSRVHVGTSRCGYGWHTLGRENTRRRAHHLVLGALWRQLAIRPNCISAKQIIIPLKRSCVLGNEVSNQQNMQNQPPRTSVSAWRIESFVILPELSINQIFSSWHTPLKMDKQLTVNPLYLAFPYI